MKKLFFSLAFIIAISINATTVVNVSNIYYILNESELTAQVTCRPYGDDIVDGWMYYSANELYVGEITIPQTFDYDTKKYTVIGLAPSAFAGSKLMTSLSLPKTITACGSGAFSLCNGLESITVANDNPTFVAIDGVMYTRSPLSIFLVPRAITGIVSINENITEIPMSAFQYCSQMDGVTIPSGVTTIKDGAFDNCTMLSEVDFGSEPKLSSIGRNAFSNCKYLQMLYLPNSVKSIGISAFSGCTDLACFSMGDSVQSIGMYAFLKCGLIGITLPATLTSIADHAFEGCTSLSTIYNKSNLNLTKGSTSNGYVAYYATEIVDQRTTTLVKENPQDLIYSQNGHIISNANNMRIYTLSGIDVTHENGHLDGIYIVKINEKAYKIKVTR